MRDIKHYYGNIDLIMGGYLVKPCMCDGENQRHYIVYKENIEYWRDEIKHENDVLRPVDFDNIIPRWVPVCKIYGYTDKFFELDEINYLVHKLHRWKKMAGKSDICLIDKGYYPTNEEPVTPIAWRIDFVGLTEDYFYEPYKDGYKLLDVKYRQVKEDK